MELLSTREWATVIWGFVFWVYAMAHKQIREALWNVVKIFFWQEVKDIMEYYFTLCFGNNFNILSVTILG